MPEPGDLPATRLLARSRDVPQGLPDGNVTRSVVLMGKTSLLQGGKHAITVHGRSDGGDLAGGGSRSAGGLCQAPRRADDLHLTQAVRGVTGRRRSAPTAA